MDRVKRGVARYLDEEFTKKMTGWQKWVFGAASSMYIENAGEVILKVKEHPAVKTLGIMDESGNVAVDKIYQQLKAQAQKGPINFEIPMIGSLTLNESDVDKLYTCIVQA
jgi:hypothetical protein